MEQILILLQQIITKGLEKFGVYYSCYRAYVIDIEDPDNLHRVRLQIPQVYGINSSTYWAWPKGIWAGKDWGIQMLPEVGDMVWVEFEFGNPRRPIWSHGYRGEGDYSEAFANKQVRGIKTKAGHQIIVDDSNEDIKIITPSGMTFHISDVIHLGSAEGESSQPAVLGDTEQEKWETLLDILLAAKINTQLGPQPFLPNTLLDLNELKISVPEIKSNFVTIKDNESSSN